MTPMRDGKVVVPRCTRVLLGFTESLKTTSDHSLREDLSVSLSSSSMSDRTGRPVGDRPGRLGKHRSSEAQIRTLLDDQKEQILAECQARMSQHEFQAARAEEEQRLLQGQFFAAKVGIS